MAKNVLKVIHILQGLQQAKHLIMLKVYGLQSTRLELTVQELQADLGIPNTTESEILMRNLGMKRVMTKFIPWLLLPEQKEHCASVPDDLIQTTTNEPDSLRKVITRDE